MKKISVLLLVFMLLTFAFGCAEDAAVAGEHTSLSTQVHESENATPNDTVFPPDDVVSFLAVGDNIIYNGQLREGKKNAEGNPDYEGEYDFRPMYQNVKDIISAADIAFVNQETVMSERFEPSQYPDFNSPQELGENLVETGFDVISIATNHMLDMGYDGLVDTIEFWKTQKVLTVGGYTDKQDFLTVRFIEKNGIKIAFVAFTYSPARADGKPAFIPTIEEELIKEWMAKANEESDFTVVSMHWFKDEYNQTPNEKQKHYAQILADSGADVILGHHPHCLQPIEWIEGEDGNKTLCFYSLGNFTSETDETVSLVGGIAQFDIVKNERTGMRIENITFIPTVMDYRNSFNKNTVYLLSEYTDEMCKSHNIVSYFGQELSMDMLCNYVSNAIDKKYLPKSYLDTLS